MSYDTVQKDKDCLNAVAPSSAFLFCGVSLYAFVS